MSPFLVCVLLSALLFLQIPLAAEMPSTAAVQMTTEDHLAQPGWWPRKGDAPRSAYVGAAACAECHSEFSKGQREHAMARSSLPVKNAKVPASTLSIGPAQYSIRSENN